MVFGRPVVSWMLFLSHAYGPIGALPPPAKVEAVRDGEVVWSTAEWFDDSPEHDDAWQTLEQYLDSRGQRPPAVPTE
jgi:hypothetical protein